MPLVRIDLPQSIENHAARDIGEAIYKAMQEIMNVPAGDKFQIITRSSSDGRNVTPEYLGIHYSEGLVLIQITLNQGRSVDLKKAFYKRVADDLARLGVRREDVFISLVEVAKENWSFGNGAMQYAQQ
jgi:phenylpyruvate tautomerase PptA (4-oxalocrotonate tautomerase family)